MQQTTMEPYRAVPRVRKRRRRSSPSWLLLGAAALLTAVAGTWLLATTSNAESVAPAAAGVPSGVTLTPSGSIRVTEDGAVIDGLEVDGRIYVAADNVTITNTRVNAGGTWYAVQIGSGVVGTTIASSELHGARSAAVSYGSYAADRVLVHSSRDGFLVGSNSSITNSHVHSLQNDGEAIKVNGGSNSVISNNRLEARRGGTGAALQLRSRRGGALEDWTISGNTLEGGRYVIDFSSRGGSVSGVHFVDNTIAEGSWRTALLRTDTSADTWSGNVLDSGAVVVGPGGVTTGVTTTSLPVPTTVTTPPPTLSITTAPTTVPPTTAAPTTAPVTTVPSTTEGPVTTVPPTTQAPSTTEAPVTTVPVTTAPSTTEAPVTTVPITVSPTTSPTTTPNPGGGPCSFTVPDRPTDDPNPDYNGSTGRYPVSQNPVPSGYPTPRTTGICGVGLEPSDLRPSGGLRITEDGTVIDGLDIDGSVIVAADNVTIRNSRITSGGRYPLQLASGSTNLTVEDTRIRGVGSGVSKATFLQGFATFRRVHLSGGSDMMYAQGGLLVEDSYFAGVYRKPGDHNDVVQVRTGSSYTFRGNTMMGTWQLATSVFLFQAKAGAGGGPISDVLIEDNYLSGGGYTIYTIAPDYPLTNAVVQNNRIEADSWQFGWRRDTAGATYRNNAVEPS